MKQLNLIDKAFLLKKTSLFGALDLDLLLTLSDKMEMRHFNEGDLIFKKGQDGNQMYLILSGEVQIEDHLLMAGEFFGDEAIFNERPRRYSAHCKEKASLLTMSRNHLLSIIAECPSVALALLKKYTQ